jgi:hypothetical protein
MALVQTDDSRVVRDTDTRALLVTDTQELYRARRSRLTAKQVQLQQQNAEAKFNSIDGRLEQCETLLCELIQHLSTLAAKYPDTFSDRE